MKKEIEQLNDDLNHAETTLGDLVESCDDWLNSEIQEPAVEMIKAIKKWIIGRHPNLASRAQSLES